MSTDSGESERGGSYRFALSTWEHGGHASGNYRATATANLDPADDITKTTILVVSSFADDPHSPLEWDTGSR